MIEGWRTRRAQRDEAERAANSASNEGMDNDGSTYRQIKAERQAFAERGGALVGGKVDARDLPVEKVR